MQTSRAEPLQSGGSRLQRSLAPRHIALITLGGVIGAGLFVGSSASIHLAGPAIVISYIIAGTIVYAVMSMIAALAVARPGVQAFTDLLRMESGDCVGFTVGWLYWYVWIIVIVIEALAGGQILAAWVPVQPWALSATLILVLMGVNLLPTRSYGEFEFWFSSIKVLAIVAFILFVTYMCLWTPSARHQTWTHLVGLPGGFMPNGGLTVLTGVVSVFFSLTGAELTTITAAEARDPTGPSRAAPALVGRIILFYVGSVLLIVCAVPWTTVVPGVSPFTTTLERLGVGWAESAMTLIILTAVLSCLNSAFFISSRVLFGLAAHGDAPRTLTELTRRGVPARGVLLVAFCTAGCFFAAIWAPGGAFAFLVNASGALILFIYLAVGFAYLGQLRRPAEGSRSFDLRRPGAWAVIVSIIGLLVSMGCNAKQASQLLSSVVPLLLTVAVWLVRAPPQARNAQETGD